MSADKSEEPSAKKLRDARDKGDVPKSRELTAALGLLVVAGALSASSASLVAGLMGLIRASMGWAQAPSVALVARATSAALATTAQLLAPLLAAAFFASALAVYFQIGAVFAPSRVAPDLARLDPLPQLGRMLGADGLVELCRSLAILVIIALVVVDALSAGLVGVARAGELSALGLLDATGSLASRIAFRAGFALLAVGAVDLLYQRRKHRKKLRMSKDELRREYRDAEGDPHAKQSRQRLHQEIVEHGALEEVRRADVLVVNPTHYAVALRFDRDGDQVAPELRAKGVDHLARRMIEAAREAGVPVLRDVPLAHALYELEVGDEIPETLYEAVAAVLTTAWAEREEEGP